MFRGSRPGERRGGRQRDTPNRRTVLTNRILTIGLEHPTAPRRDFLLALVKDEKLPADIRVAVAPRCFPPKRTRSHRRGRPRAPADAIISPNAVAEGGSAGTVPAMRDWDPQAIEALIGIVQGATADPKARRKAALKIAESLLPKAAKKAKLLLDEYGFLIRPSLAAAYRDNEHKLEALLKDPSRDIPANALMIKKLHVRSDAVRRRIQVPCPSKSTYGFEQALKDEVRLHQLGRLRRAETPLTEAQDAEEAHVKARYDAFAASPEMIARRCCKALEDAERQFNKSRSAGFDVTPLSPRARSELAVFRVAYPRFIPNIPETEKFYYDPFFDFYQAPNGNFYPPDSKLRPGAPDAGIDPWDDKSFRANSAHGPR
jgi:hypothetical protein